MRPPRSPARSTPMPVTRCARLLLTVSGFTAPEGHAGTPVVLIQPRVPGSCLLLSSTRIMDNVLIATSSPHTPVWFLIEFMLISGSILDRAGGAVAPVWPPPRPPPVAKPLADNTICLKCHNNTRWRVTAAAIGSIVKRPNHREEKSTSLLRNAQNVRKMTNDNSKYELQITIN